MLALLRQRGHAVLPTDRQGSAQVIVYDRGEDVLEGGLDRRTPDGGPGLLIARPVP